MKLEKNIIIFRAKGPLDNTYLSDKLKDIDDSKISDSYKEIVEKNITTEKEFKLVKIKFDDKILHRSRLLKYFQNEIDQKKLKRIY